MIWIPIAIIALIVFWVIGAYNNFVALKNQVLNTWKQIDVLLKRRYDLIPNLVATVKGIMSFEQDTLTKVIEARNKAASAQTVADKAVQDNVLTGALRQLFALVENYPQIKSNENVLKLQEELSSTENGISSSRQVYNDMATRLNITVQSFPANIIAGIFGFKAVELFEVTNAQEKQPPVVDLNIKK